MNHLGEFKTFIVKLLGEKNKFLHICDIKLSVYCVYCSQYSMDAKNHKSPRPSKKATPQGHSKHPDHRNVSGPLKNFLYTNYQQHIFSCYLKKATKY